MKDLFRQLFILLSILLGVRLIFPLVEQAASAPGTLVQLATSSPYYYADVDVVRPVLQRGMYFGRPSWHR